MSQFVNYNKRSIQLPPGCKDLSDIFKPAWLRNLPKGVEPSEAPRLLRHDTVKDVLGKIEKHIAMVFDSHVNMVISSLDEKLSVSLTRIMDSITSNVTFIYNEKQEEAMKAFFVRHGLTVPCAEERPTESNFLFPDLPVWSLFDLSPMPSDAPAFSKIASALFCDFCGLNAQAELQFSFIEFENAK